MFLSPVSGGVFAVVLYFIFQGGLLAGSIFPQVPALNIWIFDHHWGNANEMKDVSWGMLMVWSFIAGFAECFVPDTLDRLVNLAQQVQGTTTTTVIQTSSWPPSASDRPS
jgi:hypothetical protein